MNPAARRPPGPRARTAKSPPPPPPEAPSWESRRRVIYGASIPSFHLADGRSIDVHGLHIVPTYGGLLEGRPTEDLNPWVLDRLRRECARIFGLERNVNPGETGAHSPCVPHLIEPPRRRPLDAGRYPRRKLEDLPGYTWMVKLVSTPSALHPGAMRSELLVLWLQDGFALTPEARIALGALAWDDLAWPIDLDPDP